MSKLPKQEPVSAAERTGAESHQPKDDADTPPFTRIRWLPGSTRVMRVTESEDDIMNQWEHRS